MLIFHMKTQQFLYNNSTWWYAAPMKEKPLLWAQLVLVFASSSVIRKEWIYEQLHTLYPHADIIFASASWEIYQDEVYDNSISVTAIYFEKSSIKVHEETIHNGEESYDVWQKWISYLETKDLSHVLVFSEGNTTNGDRLVRWARSALDDKISMSWWLAGGWLDFEISYTSCNKPPDDIKKVIFIWIYGKNISIGTGSFWGWDNFWLKRVVTKSKWNIVYEFDGKPALDLYELYLWNLAEGLPTTGLLFPISISQVGSQKSVVRTLVDTNPQDRSITFAGDIPEGCYAQLMRANFERLIEGSTQAGEQSVAHTKKPDFALLISCIWRRLVLKQRIEEEIEALREILGDECNFSGFYSYWEIGPSGSDMKDCQLHNQTMTITLFKES